MNQKTFLNVLSNGKNDVIQEIIDLLDKLKINYCAIGGLAVNAYTEPIVSLDYIWSLLLTMLKNFRI